MMHRLACGLFVACLDRFENIRVLLGDAFQIPMRRRRIELDRKQLGTRNGTQVQLLVHRRERRIVGRLGHREVKGEVLLSRLRLLLELLL